MGAWKVLDKSNEKCVGIMFDPDDAVAAADSLNEYHADRKNNGYMSRYRFTYEKMELKEMSEILDQLKVHEVMES